MGEKACVGIAKDECRVAESSRPLPVNEPSRRLTSANAIVDRKTYLTGDVVVASTAMIDIAMERSFLAMPSNDKALR